MIEFIRYLYSNIGVVILVIVTFVSWAYAMAAGGRWRTECNLRREIQDRFQSLVVEHRIVHRGLRNTRRLLISIQPQGEILHSNPYRDKVTQRVPYDIFRFQSEEQKHLAWLHQIGAITNWELREELEDVIKDHRNVAPEK